MENEEFRDLPLIIGHRGASAVAPENTLSAFKRAMLDGADGIEFDVRLSRDGVPVVIHDATLARTGLLKASVGALSCAELQQTDVGKWFNRHRAARTPASAAGQPGGIVEFPDEKLPSLTQVFDLFTHYGGRLLYLEMKSEASSGSNLTAEVVRLIRESSVGERVIVSSFDTSLVQQIKVLDSTIRTAALFEPRVSDPVGLVRRSKLIELSKACGADEISLHHTLASRRLIERAKQSQLSIVVWTVDNPQWIKRARSWGIRALITNDPAAMVSYRRISAGV